jgi:toluene monooxygenase system protein E
VVLAVGEVGDMTQRTYWHLSELGRKPTDYDIASTRLLYYPERGFETAVPLAAWYRTHQRDSPLQCSDWEQFRDPRETTYGRYVELQRTKEAFVDGVLAAAEQSGHDRRLSPAWLDALGGLLPPLRYPVHGLQMIAAYVGQMAPSGRIAIACLLQGGDETRRVERLAYRMRQLQDVAAGFGSDARARWEGDEIWQPLRELIERLLVTYDWGEAFVALACVVKPRLDSLFTTHLAELARRAGDDVLANLAFSFGEDCRWHREWHRALLDVALADRPGNRAVIAQWIARWTPLAARAVASFAPVFEPRIPQAIEAAVGAWIAAAELGDAEPAR